MASFLQNNGDIILDAVLTDYGRKLLAKGDGSFKIVKFSLGDDEIDYGLFQPDEETMLNDVELMKTPILESITNNAVSLKSNLLTLGVDNILFLPVMKLHTSEDTSKTGSFSNGFSGFVVPVDTENSTGIKSSNMLKAFALEEEITQINNSAPYINGVLNVNTRNIIIDHGLDSNKLSNMQNLEDVYPMLYEREFNLVVDNRFCIVGKNANNSVTTIPFLSIDDDNMALYKLTEQTIVNNLSFVMKLTGDMQTSILGTKGSRVQFTVTPNLQLQYSDSMFDKYGKEQVLNSFGAKEFVFKTIRTSVRLNGLTTGCSITIPILLAKYVRTDN